MDENIGKGCECIYRFEKNIVDLLLEREIEKVTGDMEQLKISITEEKRKPKEQQTPFLPSIEASLDIGRLALLNYGTVRDRFKAMPPCD